ncbi:hypothetical protein CK203_063634 [Vitis vinifera]|uniref:Uncharacterized protein n=1 Tax=Vitis vinifera TaxID=29760 RepID=A0A438G4U0_VITVI|nr:hypothetical protein CK203_063634 [Vitis vinifera]
MLEDDVRAATQQVLVADRHLEVARIEMPNFRTGQAVRSKAGRASRPERPPLTPLSISYEKLLPMIQGLSDFRWPRPLGTDPSKRDHKRDVPSTRNMATRQKHADASLFGRKAHQGGTSKKYLRSDTRADLVQASVVSHMGHSLTGLENPGNPIRIQRVVNYFLGRHCTAVQAGPVTLNVQFSVPVSCSPMLPDSTRSRTSQEDASLLSPAMHVTNSNYWVRRTKILRQRIPCKQSKFRKKDSPYEISSLLTPEETQNMQNALRQNHDVFAWAF